MAARSHGSSRDADAEFRSLIVPLDLTDNADRALPVARVLARRGRVPVHLITTISPGLDPTADRFELAERAESFEGCEADVTVLATNDATAALADYRRAQPEGLVCLATHGHTALGELVLGSTADDLLHQQLGPILLVGPRSEPDELLGNRLLVCVDDATIHTAILAVTATWRATFDGAVEVLEAVDDVRSPTPLTATPTPALRAAAASLHDVTTTVAPAHDPVSAILDAACEPGTVVVVASHLRRGLGRALLGSVAWEVVRHSTAPVLVVPTHG